MHFITNKHYSGSILTGSVAVGAHYILQSTDRELEKERVFD